MRGTKDDPGEPALTSKGISMLSMDRPGKEVGFHGIPLPLWERLPGVVTHDLGDGMRVKTLCRRDRKVTFYSEPDEVRR